MEDRELVGADHFFQNTARYYIRDTCSLVTISDTELYLSCASKALLNASLLELKI